ncbi:MAG TPA: ABC transporter permease [Euryarchaeota archaeon]|nr:ABC transporter permease [Euryarchaeota archaeon]
MAVSSYITSLKNHLTTLKVAAWLGWQIESNWTSPFLFALYAIIKPLAHTLILVFIFVVATGGQGERDMFDFMYIGNAFFMYVAQVLFGISWIIHDEREHYETLKYVYTAPISFYMFLSGRAFAKFIFTTVAVIITMAFGILVLGVNVNISTINPLLFACSFFVGVLGIASFGIVLGAISLITARHGGTMNEVFSGIFYLLSGVMYPIGVLPLWTQSISRFLPVTYWLEAMRRSMLPALNLPLPTTLEMYSDWSLVAILFVSTVLFFSISTLVFTAADRIARRYGLIDMHTAY